MCLKLWKLESNKHNFFQGGHSILTSMILSKDHYTMVNFLAKKINFKFGETWYNATSVKTDIHDYGIFEKTKFLYLVGYWCNITYPIYEIKHVRDRYGLCEAEFHVWIKCKKLL